MAPIARRWVGNHTYAAAFSVLVNSWGGEIQPADQDPSGSSAAHGLGAQWAQHIWPFAIQSAANRSSQNLPDCLLLFGLSPVCNSVVQVLPLHWAGFAAATTDQAPRL